MIINIKVVTTINIKVAITINIKGITPSTTGITRNTMAIVIIHIITAITGTGTTAITVMVAIPRFIMCRMFRRGPGMDIHPVD